FALATVAALLSTQSMAQVQPAVMKAAFSDPARPEADTRQDASRHPAELVAFSKVKAGDTVVDLVPGGGYWSRLFSTAVGPKGKVYAYVPGEFAGFKSDPVATAKAIASEPGRGNVEQITLPLAQ